MLALILLELLFDFKWWRVFLADLDDSALGSDLLYQAYKLDLLKTQLNIKIAY